MNLTSEEFKAKCFPRGDVTWTLVYPDDGLLPLQGNISDDLMRKPDM